MLKKYNVKVQGMAWNINADAKIFGIPKSDCNQVDWSTHAWFTYTAVH